jgi:SAM-dependent methyltransferase
MRQNYEETMSKKKLQEKRLNREKILSSLGFFPLSLWTDLDRPRLLDKFVNDEMAKERSYAKHEFSVRQGALSQFYPEVARRIITFWSKPGDIIFDPFMERCPRILVANYLKRNAIGNDLWRETWEHDVKKIFNIEPTKDMDYYGGEVNGLRIDLYNRDSRKLYWIQDNSVDMVFCSPPYWKIETYGDEPQQLGTGTEIGGGDKPTYEEFLQGLKQCIAENYRILKPNKKCIYAVNDFRIEGFIPFHADVINLFREVGFKIHDIVIYKLGGLAAVFLRDMIRDERMAKVHEYLICGRKPSPTKSEENESESLADALLKDV